MKGFIQILFSLSLNNIKYHPLFATADKHKKHATAS